ncbi:hypothetical protein ACCO45_010602 [Purpureocillium lilacinum]|uniref:Uncharacterized protein n=1 Tax=Purpureocillium lilacinum TaxID=33203 RepID=A0ACC4DFH3_PURLI
MDGWEGPFGSRPLRHPATWLGDDARKCDSRVCRGGSQPGSTAAPGTKSRGTCLFRFPCAQSGLGENTVAHAPGQPRMPFARIVGSTKPCRCCLGEAARQASDARHAHPLGHRAAERPHHHAVQARARVCAAPPHAVRRSNDGVAVPNVGASPVACAEPEPEPDSVLEMEENSRPHTIGCRAYDRLAIEPCPSTHPATPAHSIARQLPRGWLPESFAGKAPEATDSWASIDGDGGVGLRQLRWSPGILSCLGRPVPSLFSALLTWLRLLGLLLPLPARIMAATRAGHDVRWESAMSARRQWRTWPSLPILAADGLRPGHSAGTSSAQKIMEDNV